MIEYLNTLHNSYFLEFLFFGTEIILYYFFFTCWLFPGMHGECLLPSLLLLFLIFSKLTSLNLWKLNYNRKIFKSPYRSTRNDNQWPKQSQTTIWIIWKYCIFKFRLHMAIFALLIIVRFKIYLERMVKLAYSEYTHDQICTLLNIQSIVVN